MSDGRWYTVEERSLHRVGSSPTPSATTAKSTPQEQEMLLVAVALAHYCPLEG